MVRAFKYATIFVVLSIFGVPWANAADLSSDYLYGRWVIDAQDCNSPDSEYMEFNKTVRLKGREPAKLKSSDSGG